MDRSSLILSSTLLVLLTLSSTILSSSSDGDGADKADSFTPTNCTSDSECNAVCHKGGFLYSRCDKNGTCICDCSDPSVVDSSYTSSCAGRQPEGYWWDQCDAYCRQEYRRPCRYCTSDKSKFYCTCVCNYGKIGIGSGNGNEGSSAM